MLIRQVFLGGGWSLSANQLELVNNCSHPFNLFSVFVLITLLNSKCLNELLRLVCVDSVL